MKDQPSGGGGPALKPKSYVWLVTPYPPVVSEIMALLPLIVASLSIASFVPALALESE